MRKKYFKIGFLGLILFQVGLIRAFADLLDAPLVQDKEEAKLVTRSFKNASSGEFILEIQKWAWYRHIILNFELHPFDRKNRREIDFNNKKTLTDVLKKDFKQYTWEINGNVLNIYPTVFRNDSNYVMNWIVPSFGAENENRFQIFYKLQALLRRLYPTKIELSEGLLYKLCTAESDIKDPGRLIPISFKIKNSTVRDILNKISVGENAFWTSFPTDDMDPNIYISFSLEKESFYFGELTREPNWIRGVEK